MSAKNQIVLVAEIAQAHEGSLGLLHSYIDALADTGVDVVKFQTHLAEAESSSLEPFRIKFSYEDATRFDYWKRMEFSLDQWKEIKAHCEKAGMEFMASPFSVAAVDLLESVGVKRYKIGSGEVSNFLLLHSIAKTGKPMILSAGMSSLDELRKAIQFVAPFGNPVSLLQCTTAYPTRPEQWGLAAMATMKHEFNVPVGFSDHSGDLFACLAATALGATMLEFHVVFDKRMFGPDTAASLTIDQVKMLVKGVREIETSLNYPEEKSKMDSYDELKRIFGKSLAVNRSMAKGEPITISDLESKKPADQGISASLYMDVIGKKMRRDIPANSFLKYDDLE